MTLILSNDDVDKLLTMRECIDVLEEAYVELAEGRGVTRTRSDCITPTANPDAVYGLKSMDGVIPKFGIGAIRINSDIVTFPKKGNNVVREKVPAAPNGRYTGLVLLFSTEDGRAPRDPAGRRHAAHARRRRQRSRHQIPGPQECQYRRHPRFRLAGRCATHGSLRGARHQVDPLLQSDPIKSRAVRRADAQLLGVEVEPVGQPEEATSGADIVMCASNSLDNIFFERWIEPGMHLSSIKLPEIELKAIKRADRVLLHAHESSPVHHHDHGSRAGEEGQGARLVDGERARLREAADAAGDDRGQQKGRQSDEEVTCFLNNIGLGYQFAAAGSVVYRRAVEAGVGRELPTEWFTEDVHP